METTSTMWGSSSTTSTRTRPESELTATIIERLSEDSLRRRRGDAASDPPPPAPRQTARAARFPDAIANAARPLIGGPPHARVPTRPPDAAGTIARPTPHARVPIAPPAPDHRPHRGRRRRGGGRTRIRSRRWRGSGQAPDRGGWVRAMGLWVEVLRANFKIP